MAMRPRGQGRVCIPCPGATFPSGLCALLLSPCLASKHASPQLRVRVHVPRVIHDLSRRRPNASAARAAHSICVSIRAHSECTRAFAHVIQPLHAKSALARAGRASRDTSLELREAGERGALLQMRGDASTPSKKTILLFQRRRAAALRLARGALVGRVSAASESGFCQVQGHLAKAVRRRSKGGVRKLLAAAARVCP